MPISTMANYVSQFQFIFDIRAIVIHGLIIAGFLFGIAFMFATLFRVMEQLDNDPMTLFQHKLVKWLYLACLVIVSLIGLGMIAVGGTGFIQMLFGDSNQAFSQPMQIRLWIAFQVTSFFIFVMAWVLPACDKMLTKFKKG